MNQIAEIKKSIQILQLIDQYGSIRQTAQKLYITQPAVSRYLLRLEKSLGTRLVNRDEHPYQLTPAGQYYLQEQKKSYQHQITMSQRLKLLGKTEFQQLNLGINSTLATTLLPQIFPKFHHQYPGVLLNVVEDHNSELRRQLLSGQIDVQIGFGQVDQSHLQDASLVNAAVSLVIPKRLITPEKQALLTPLPTTNIGPLLDHLPIFQGIANSGFQAAIDEYLLNQHISTDPVLSNMLMPTGIALIKVGAGAMIMPNFLIDQFLSDQQTKQSLFFQPIQKETLSYPVKIYWNSWFKNQDVISSLITLGRAAFSSKQPK